MSTLRSPWIAREQERLRKTQENRAKGIRPMSEYNQERKKRKEHLKQQVKQLKEQGKSYSQIAEMLSLSRAYVIRLYKDD